LLQHLTKFMHIGLMLWWSILAHKFGLVRFSVF